MFQLEKYFFFTSSVDSVRTTYWLYNFHHLMLWVGGKFLSIKTLSSFLLNQEHHIHTVLILLLHPALYSAYSVSQSALLTESKTCGWPKHCLSSFADRQMLLMGTVWAEDWHLKGQTLNVVISTASGPPQTPLPLWAQVNAVMSDRSTCFYALALCDDVKLLLDIFFSN